jgi:hypothetical protein
MHNPFDGNHADPLLRGMDVQARWGHLQCRVVCTNVLPEILSGRWQRLVLTGHTGEQIFEWLRCRGGESIAQPRHLATAATQSGALFLVLKANCITVCAPMWHGTQWVYHQPLHFIHSVQGLLPSSPNASPLLSYLLLVSRLAGLPWQHAWERHPVPWLPTVVQQVGLPWQHAWQRHPVPWLPVAVQQARLPWQHA